MNAEDRPEEPQTRQFAPLAGLINESALARFREIRRSAQRAADRLGGLPEQARANMRRSTVRCPSGQRVLDCYQVPAQFVPGQGDNRMLAIPARRSQLLEITGSSRPWWVRRGGQWRVQCKCHPSVTLNATELLAPNRIDGYAVLPS